MATPDVQLACVWPLGAVVGEGALWDEEKQALYFVDIKAPAVHRFVPATGARRSWPMPERIGCLARRRVHGGFVAGFKSGFAFVDLETGRIERIGTPEPDRPGNRFNDGTCDPSGNFWAGTMDDDERAATGWLYRLDPQRHWTRTDGAYVCTNGPAFTADGRLMYHVDTFARTVHALEIGADGLPVSKRAHIRFSADEGYPDGMTVDADGFLWVCHWGGWRVTRFRPDGRVDRSIRLPVAQVTRCAFGGPDFKTLCITSAAIGIGEAERGKQPLAGGLFACEPGMRGLPAQRYAG